MQSKWRARTARIIEIFMGLVFLIAGGLKAYEPLDFIRQIGDYQLLTSPGPIKVVAWVMIAVEIALGTALIVGYRRRVSVPLAAVVLVGFLVTLGWAWHVGATEDCGCFGSWVKRTPAEAFMEDLFMLGAICFAWWLHRHEEVGVSRWRPATVLLSALIGLSVTALASNSARQSDDPMQRMKARATQPNLFENVNVEGVPVDVKVGTRVIALIDTGCSHCQASVPELNRLSGELKASDTPLVALCSNRPEEVEAFVAKYKAEFPMGRVSYDDFTRLFERGKPPRMLLIQDGALLRLWDGVVPPISEVMQK